MRTVILRRIWAELLGMGIIGGLLFILNMSDTSPMGLALFMYKALLFSASQLHAMLTRKLFFPYIDFQYASDGSKAMIIAIHVISAYVYAAGG